TTAPAPSAPGGALPLGGAAGDRDEEGGRPPLAAPAGGRTTRRHRIPWAAAAGALARLEILSGKSQGEVHPLGAQEHRVGTARNADVPLRDRGISFTHATILHVDGAFFVTDMGSRDGT